MKTRERIKETAVKLFNEKGATNVSTVQLSDKLRISPGNLYYYFSNKEHIIRAIWEEDMVPQSDAIYFRPANSPPHLYLFHLLEDLSDHGMNYRFFYTEVYTLIKNDPQLQTLYRARWDRLVDHLTGILSDWEKEGMVKTTTQGFKKIMAENLLLIGPATIHSSLAIYPEKGTKDALQQSVVGACVMLCSLFSDQAKQELMDLLTQKGYPIHCS